VASELNPSFIVTPTFDGDDDAELQEQNFLAELYTALAALQRDGYCVWFKVTRASAPEKP
jgi:hypothetical protein